MSDIQQARQTFKDTMEEPSLSRLKVKFLYICEECGKSFRGPESARNQP